MCDGVRGSSGRFLSCIFPDNVVYKHRFKGREGASHMGMWCCKTVCISRVVKLGKKTEREVGDITYLTTFLLLDLLPIVEE